MPETFEGNGSEDKEYDAFMLMEHDQNWSSTVEKGIPLLERFTAAGDTDKATDVRNVLDRTRTVMMRSGAGDPQSKQFLKERIEKALGA